MDGRAAPPSSQPSRCSDGSNKRPAEFEEVRVEHPSARGPVSLLLDTLPDHLKVLIASNMSMCDGMALAETSRDMLRVLRRERPHLTLFYRDRNPPPPQEEQQRPTPPAPTGDPLRDLLSFVQAVVGAVRDGSNEEERPPGHSMVTLLASQSSLVTLDLQLEIGEEELALLTEAMRKRDAARLPRLEGMWALNWKHSLDVATVSAFLTTDQLTMLREIEVHEYPSAVAAYLKAGKAPMLKKLMVKCAAKLMFTTPNAAEGEDGNNEDGAPVVGMRLVELWDDIAHAIADGAAPGLEELHLDGMDISKEASEALAAFVTRGGWQSLRVLNLSTDKAMYRTSPSIGPIVQALAATATAGLPALEALYLSSFSHVPQESAACVATAVRLGRLPKLRSLMLIEWNLGSDAAVELFQGLRARHVDVIDLVLIENGICDQALTRLAPLLVSGGLARLNSLCLNGNAIGSQASTALLDVFSSGAGSHLKDLGLRNTRMSPPDLCAWADALRSSTNFLPCLESFNHDGGKYDGSMTALNPLVLLGLAPPEDPEERPRVPIIDEIMRRRQQRLHPVSMKLRAVLLDKEEGEREAFLDRQLGLLRDVEPLRGMMANYEGGMDGFLAEVRDEVVTGKTRLF